MNALGEIFPLVIAIIVAGLVISVMSGSYAHWLAIILALAVVAGIAGSAGR